MELKNHDVLVVSAFGRGDWLATELKAQGLSVFLVDVSSQLGVWPAEDMEGPFGLFMLERYPQSFLEFLSHQDQFTALDSGFVIWLGDGPVEMKSPLTSYRFQQMGLHPEMWQCLNRLSSHAAKEESFLNQEFSVVWPLHLAHQVASTTFHVNAEASQYGEGVPLLNTFLTRSATRMGLEKSLAWVASKGVKVAKNHEVLDIALGGRRQLTGLELKGEQAGFFKFNSLVWTLTSEHTYFMNERIGKKLFPQGAIESTWCWMRFRLKVKNCMEVAAMPAFVCIMEDVMAPWTHENFCLTQKTPSPENIDVWVRLPTVQRFNKEYLHKMGEKIIGLFARKLPLSEPSVLSYPQEYYYTYKELGPPRFPIFIKSDNSSRRYTFFNNFYRDGIEAWSNFSKDSQYDFQQNLVRRLVKDWQQRQLKEKPRELEK